MKKLQSKAHPEFPPNYVSDEIYDLIVQQGKAKLYVVTDMEPLKTIIPSRIKIEVTKAPTKNINERRGKKDFK